MVTKIESAISKHTSAMLKADNVEQKMHAIQETLKRTIPSHDKDKQHMESN